MQDLFNEIKGVPAVMGSYLHITGVGDINSDLPKIFLAKLKEIGEIFDRVIKVNLATNMQTNTIEFRYDEATIFLKPIDQDSCLITFAEGDINRNLLNMTTGMLNDELKQTVAQARKDAATRSHSPQHRPVAPDTRPGPAQPPVAQKPASIDVNKIIHAGPMARIFQGFQDALAMAIGPIAETVMKESVEIWARAGNCSQERLPELVELLIREIDDVSLEAEFKLAIQSHLH